MLQKTAGNPGRPSHAYHTYFIGTLRLVLDVEVTAGHEHSAAHGFGGLWRLWEEFAPAQRPELIRGDCPYGQEALMGECEARGQKYLFRLRQTKGVKQLIAALERQGRWVDAGAGWQAREGTLRLMGWSRERRVVVLRRDASAPRAEPPIALPEPSPAGAATPAAPSGLLVEVAPEPAWEFIVLVTNLDWEPRSLAQSYRQRADCEPSRAR